MNFHLLAVSLVAIFIAMILHVTDCLTVGSTYFKSDILPETDLPKLSMSIYALSTFASQLVGGLTTSINYGVLFGAIVENAPVTSAIYDKIHAYHDEQTAITNTLFMIFVATIVFAMSSILIGYLEIGTYLEYIPRTVTVAIFFTIGVDMLSAITAPLETEVNPENILIFTLGLITTIVFFAISEWLPGKYILIHILSFFIVAAFCTIAYICKLTNDTLISRNWLYRGSKESISLFAAYRLFDPQKVSLSIIYTCINQVTELVFMSHIHLPINLAGYSNEIGEFVNINRELLTQGYINIISAFCFSPTYFIYSYSFLFKRSGGINRYSSILMSIALFFIMYPVSHLKSIVPTFVLTSFPGLIGISMVYSSLLQTKKRGNYLDVILVCIIVLTSLWSKEKVLSILLGLLIELLKYFIYQYIACQDKSSHIAEPGLIFINEHLTFANIHRIKIRILKEAKINKMVIVRISKNVHIDWTASDILKRLQDSSGLSRLIIQQP